MQDVAALCGQLANLLRPEPEHAERPVRLKRDPGTGGAQVRCDPMRVGGADLDPFGGVLGDQLRQRHVREQPPAADDQQMIRGQRHLAHQVAGDQDRAALLGQRPHERPDPQDPLRVEPVDRLIEQQRARIAEQRPGDAQPLRHAQGKAADPPARHRRQPDHLEHLIDPRAGNAVGHGEAEQVVVRRSARVHGRGHRAARRPRAAATPCPGNRARPRSRCPRWADRARGSCAWWSTCRPRSARGTR